MKQIHIIGAGLAGCECANALAQSGIKVKLYEMKPHKKSAAHKTVDFAELVCSNSLKADRLASASGMLKAEMHLLDSIVLEAAKLSRVPAGGALAVDRNKFSEFITRKIKANPNIEVISGEVTEIPSDGIVVIATGPLTSDGMTTAISRLCGDNLLNFYDAAAPIVTYDSIDTNKTFFAARYDRGDADYINCPFDRDEYEAFVDELCGADAVELKEFEKQYFRVYEGCMPIEVLAKRGRESLRFGPLKPVGLTDPRTERRPYAVVQLRKENDGGTLYNLVGFQTNLKFPEQKRVFSMIPGLSNAEFVRYGVMHRNTFIDSPRLLDSSFRLRSTPRIFFAGQITGVEGYVESAAVGLLTGRNIKRLLEGKECLRLPVDSMLGALSGYISDSSIKSFQPMGANMGILPPLDERIKDKLKRYERTAQRGLKSFKESLIVQCEINLS